MKVQIRYINPEISPSKNWTFTEIVEDIVVDKNDIMLMHYNQSPEELAVVLSKTLKEFDGLWIKLSNGNIKFINKLYIQRMEVMKWNL